MVLLVTCHSAAVDIAVAQICIAISVLPLSMIKLQTQL